MQANNSTVMRLSVTHSTHSETDAGPLVRTEVIGQEKGQEIQLGVSGDCDSPDRHDDLGLVLHSLLYQVRGPPPPLTGEDDSQVKCSEVGGPPLSEGVENIFNCE